MSSKNNISKNKRYFHKQLDLWSNIVAQNLNHLSKPQATVLALMSLGMIVAESCALSAISSKLAFILKAKSNTIRQRIRELCYDSKDKKDVKKGAKRTQLDVQTCFPFLLRWIVSLWQSKQMAIALDATALKLSFTVLVVSVVYRGCAIPVAWTIHKGNDKKSWNKEWLRMLRLFRPSIPKDFTVIVLTDRGLYSPKLYRRIVRLKWHPFMRINTNGTFCPQGGSFKPIRSFANQPNTRWQGVGVAFKTKDKRIACTLLACWEEGHQEAWFVLTDLLPEVSNVYWYGMRTWIEQGFKMIKRGGWQWHKTRMTDPQRASRLWLGISVATLWLLSVGGEAEANIPDSTIPDVRDYFPQPSRKRKATMIRLVSIFRVGLGIMFSCLYHHESLPFGRFIPEHWSGVKLL